MKRIALGLFVLTLVFVAFVRVRSLDRERAREPAWQGWKERPEAASGATPAELVQADAVPAPGSSTPDEVPPPARERLEHGPLAGILRGLEPGSEALLTWSALLPEFEGLRTPAALDLERLRAATVATTCEARGRFAFASVPSGALEGDSVVWTTLEGREASAVLLAPSARGWRWPEDAGSVARAAVRVRVLRAGEPVAGANVRHTLSFWETGQSEAEQRQRRVFLRETRTGADGATLVVPGRGENLVAAWAGEERAIPWLGQPEGDLVLELLPTLAVSGHVRVEGPAPEAGELRYLVGFFSAADGSDLQWSGTTQGVRADGSFGPDPWPRLERAQLAVYVRGGEFVPVQVAVPNPPLGEGAVVELATRRGAPFEVLVSTPEGKPLEGAQLDAWHWSAGGWLQLPGDGTAADGRAVVFSAPGELQVQVSKKGFATWMLQEDARSIVPQTAAPLRVILRPAGVVSGWVHAGSAPVERFSILAWNDDRSFCPTLAFEDEEGAFRLEDVPKGVTIHVCAYSDTLPQSPTEAFVLGEEPLELELELPTPRKARGRVIDSVTREPVPSARIQHLLTGMDGLAAFRGQEMGVQVDGRFELDGFFPGRGGFACLAEGYDELYYSTREDDTEVIDVGLLALNPLGVLEVEVHEDGVGDFSAYRAWNRSNTERSPQPLASDGTLVLPSRTGHFQLNVLRPDGEMACAVGSLLPGERERVVLDFSRGIELTVLLEPPPAGIEDWSLHAFTRARDFEHCAKSRWSSERRAFVLRALSPGDAVLELRDGEDALVAQRSLRLTDDARQSFSLPMAGERRRVRLVDGEGRPWASRPVTVALEDASGWSTILESDAQGEIELGPLDARRIVLSAKLANESIAYGIAVDLEPDPARTTVVQIDVGPRSLLRLTELGRAVPGLAVYYTYERGPRLLQFGYISDESGLVRGPFLGPGAYTLCPNHRDFWPTRTTLVRRDSPEPLSIELFSRGTLAIEVTTLSGRPIAGARLALVHNELGESVDDWLAAGALPGPTGLVTDSAGQLVLTGIPRGDYAWTCRTPDGTQSAGAVQLAPRASETLSIRVRE